MFGMKRPEPTCGLDDDVIVACKRRKMLLHEQKDELNNKLFKILSGCKSKKNLGDVYDQVKELLGQGADPDSNSFLWLTANKEGYSKIVSLLLAYGANPNVHVGITDFAIPIVDATDLSTIQVLVQKGADINASKPRSRKTLLSSLCDEYGADNLPALVWALSHGADPNVGPESDCTNKYACFAIHKALFNCSLEKVIALLQCGANLSVKTDFFANPITYAEDILCRSKNADSILVPAAQAQFDLLRAVKEYELVASRIYTIHEYEAMGISPESVELIIAATKKVNETTVPVCAR